MVCKLINQWVDYLQSPAASPYELKQFQTKQVNGVIDKWKALAGKYKNGNELESRLKELSHKISTLN